MMGNIFTTEYKLNQHTMLLHFQDESDACLRASEVKPKLDRFIVKKFNGKDEFKQAHASWIQTEHQNGKDVALKYRMTIKRAAGAEIKKYGASDPQYKIPKIFYGNMSDGSNNSNKKTGVFFINETDESSLILTITCFDKDLESCIDKNIAEFFAVTNFGTMQSKGFGSFTVMGDKYKCDIPKALRDYYGAMHCYKINIENCDDVQNEEFETIKQLYSVMKSGSRRPFDHAYIYRYMHDEERGNIGNEKAAMKNSKVSPALGREGMGGFSETFQYVRAVLGLGSTLSYITDNPWWYELDGNGRIKFDRKHVPIVREDRDTSGRITKRMKENIEITHVKDDNGTDYPTGSKEKIERFQSPIMFKIVGNQIYIVAGRIDPNDPYNPNVLGKYFVFKNDCRNRTSREGLSYRNNQTNGKVVLQVPESFDIDDFMESFVGYYNNTYLTKNPRPAKIQRIEVAI